LRLLVIEDDPDLNRQLATALTDAGYVVDRAYDGEEGHYLGESEPYDAVILDIGLPKMDGISVLEAWRRAGRAMPVLILTARDRWSDKVQGFDAGADDYVAKPFHLEEVLARIRALLRRSAGHAKSELNCGAVRLDTRTGRVSVDGNPVKLTSHEYRGVRRPHPQEARRRRHPDRARAWLPADPAGQCVLTPSRCASSSRRRPGPW
jgi:two-component system, OmpR family, response regulator